MQQDQYDEIAARARELFHSGADVEQVIAFLRASGLSQVWSAKVLVEVARMPLDDAKDAIHLSPTWADVRSAAEALHDVIEQSTKVDR